MKRIVGLFLILVSVFSFFSCEDEDDTVNEPYLIVKFQFDPNQVRLNNLGQPATIPPGHAAQSPDFSKISAHYFELAPTAYTQLGDGAILYHADETTAGGTVAIDFSKAVVVGEGEAFLKIPLSQVAQGNYEYVRVSFGLSRIQYFNSKQWCGLSRKISEFCWLQFLHHNTFYW